MNRRFHIIAGILFAIGIGGTMLSMWTPVGNLLRPVRGVPSRVELLLVQDEQGELLSVHCDGGVTTPTGSMPGSPGLAERWRAIIYLEELCE